MFLPLLYAFGVFATSVCIKSVLKQYIIRMLQYVYTYGNFQETFKHGFMYNLCHDVLTPKQFPGLSVSYLQNSTQILNMIEISAV